MKEEFDVGDTDVTTPDDSERQQTESDFRTMDPQVDLDPDTLPPVEAPDDTFVGGVEVLRPSNATPSDLDPESETLKPGADGSSGKFQRRPEIQRFSMESIRRSLQTLHGEALEKKLLLAASYLAVFLAGAFFYRTFLAETAPPEAADVQRGEVRVISHPGGAVIWVDGEALLVEGEPAKTPIKTLGSLKYGVEYTVQLTKSGYRPWSRTFVMSREIDGSTFDAKLEPE